MYVFTVFLTGARLNNLIPYNTALDMIQVLDSRNYFEGVWLMFRLRTVSVGLLQDKQLAIDQMTQLLQMDSDRRPSSNELLEHPYFAKYDV